MVYTSFRSLVGWCLAILMLPAFTFAAGQPICSCGIVTPKSYTHNFSKEAARILTQIHADAYQASDVADMLEAFNREPTEISWQADASQLRKLSALDNRMDKMLCRLQEIDRVLPADQQAEIKQLAPPVIELSDNTRAASQALSSHETAPFASQYRGLVPILDADANRAETASARADQYAEVHYSYKQFDTRQPVKSNS
jgi:hypothetical protein